jgi:hypothetical protein
MTVTTRTELEAVPRRYRRNTWQEAIAEYLPEGRRTPRAFRWINRLPLIGILLVMSALSLRLRNSAMIDEALYINLGNQYLHGPAPTPSETDYLSGAPGLYPVVAGTLDTVGGLWLVRLFSLACVVVAVICVDQAAGALYRSRRAGIFAALALALSAPVIFLGGLATFDALVVMLLAVALALATTRTSLLSGAVIGVILAVASVTKYAAAPLALAVLVMLLVIAPPKRPHRALLAVLSFVTALWLAWARWGETLGPGIEFTTSAREALGPTSRVVLVGMLMVTLGLVLALALSGALRPGPRALGRARTVLLNAVLLGGGLALPLGQLHLGEGISFTKHLAYSALFLAPLAGLELAVMSRGMLRLLPVGVITAIALLVGWSGSATMYGQWVDVSPVVDHIEANPVPGTYLSSSADVLAYYTDDHPQIAWDTTFALYAAGEGPIRDAVARGQYQTIVLRTSSTGSPVQDQGQAVLRAAIEADPRYGLAVEPFPVQRWSQDRWLIYTKELSGS